MRNDLICVLSQISRYINAASGFCDVFAVNILLKGSDLVRMSGYLFGYLLLMEVVSI